ncbi:MAG: hypothetical protein Q8N96_11465 [Methylovulum sp.]|nr:hypothetical protein [Methylovulum sp.]
MQRAISTNKLYITGAETEEHSVSIETVTTVLLGIQKTAYLLASAKLQQPLQKRFTLNKDIKKHYALQCGVPAPGSYLMPISQYSSGELFEDDDILADINTLFEAISTNSREKLQQLIPDSHFCEKVLREVLRFLPKVGSSWDMCFQHADCVAVTLNGHAIRSVESWLSRPEEQDAVMTVTGELIRIDFSKNIVTLRYPPNSRELECSYFQDIEDTIIENKRELIQVTGRFTLDEQGHPKSLTDVTRIEPVDLSPMVFDCLELNGRVMRFSSKLIVEPVLDEEASQLLVIEDEALGIHVYAQNREILADELTAELFFLWDEYAFEASDNLTIKAQALKAALLEKCQVEDCAHAQG